MKVLIQHSFSDYDVNKKFQQNSKVSFETIKTFEWKKNYLQYIFVSAQIK